MTSASSRAAAPSTAARCTGSTSSSRSCSTWRQVLPLREAPFSVKFGALGHLDLYEEDVAAVGPGGGGGLG